MCQHTDTGRQCSLHEGELCTRDHLPCREQTFLNLLRGNRDALF